MSQHPSHDGQPQGISLTPSSQQGAETPIEDLRLVLRELGLFDGARPISAHAVVHQEVLPAISTLVKQVSTLTAQLTEAQQEHEAEKFRHAATLDSVNGCTAKVVELVAKLRAEQGRRKRLEQLAKEATNGWACYAKRDIEHHEIARLHAEIRKLSAALTDAREPGTQERG